MSKLKVLQFAYVELIDNQNTKNWNSNCVCSTGVGPVPGSLSSRDKALETG